MSNLTNSSSSNISTIKRPHFDVKESHSCSKEMKAFELSQSVAVRGVVSVEERMGYGGSLMT